MRLLHVGSGFRPWRRGGLVAYTEDLMAAQRAAGHDVTYFFAGRHYPLVGGPRLRRWERDGIAMLEVVNSPLHDHGRQPELEIGEPRVEAMLRRAIGDHRPDVVHVHELAGLPSSVLEIPRRLGLPVVFTLQDYFAVCPVFKLTDSRGRSCLECHTGADCARTVEHEEQSPGLLVEGTIKYELGRLPRVDRASLGVHRVAAAAGRRVRARGAGGPPSRRGRAFQRRRELNVARLNHVDCLIAMSGRVAEIHAMLGVDAGRIRTMQLTLSHIERLSPRTIEPRDARPVTFMTLGGLESAAKGAEVLLDAVRIASVTAGDDAFRVLVHGYAEPRYFREAERLPAVELRGRYAAAELDAVLDDADVGLMTSTWEEAYGYAGVEFLAKAVPVLGNAIGGIPEYTRPGQTGWLNRSCSARELADVMLDIIARPEQIADLNATLRARREEIVKPMRVHLEEMDEVYRRLVAHWERR